MQHVTCQVSEIDLSSMKFKEQKIAMRKYFIAKVCHHRWNGFKMGEGEGQRAGIQKSIKEMNKRLEMKIN